MTRAFSPRVVAEMRERIQAIVDDLLARVTPARQMDVIADLAIPLPTMVIAALLGIPEADRDQLKVWSDDFAAFIGGPTTDEGNRRADDALRELSAYFGRAIDRCRRAPGDNLISHLVTVEVQGDALTPTEILATCILLLIGGHETTTNLIGNGLLALLNHPDQLGQLRRQPSLLPPRSRNSSATIARCR